jgi:signal transduction histidine kinase
MLCLDENLPIFEMTAAKIEPPDSLALTNLEDKLRTLGYFTGGIIHDFNNLLTGMSGHISYLKAILPARGQHVECLDALDRAVKSSCQLTKKVSQFTQIDGGNEDERGVIDLNATVSNSVRLMKVTLAPLGGVRIELPEATMRILGSEVEIEQVVVNLLSNAKDSMAASSGEIICGIERVTQNHMITPPKARSESGSWLWADTFMVTPEYVRLFVSDPGIGIDPQVAERVFEPFVSTKKSGGSGLGLATVARIMRRLDGVIELESNKGYGTTVNLYFPLLSEGTLRQVLGENNLPVTEVLSEKDADLKVLKLLIIDDDELVREVFRQGLTILGYDVSVAVSGKDGLMHFRSDPHGYNLIILDMLMPDIPGSEVLYAVRELKPEIPILLVSGMYEARVIAELKNLPRVNFLKKPFTITDLAKQIEIFLKP